MKFISLLLHDGPNNYTSFPIETINLNSYLGEKCMKQIYYDYKKTDVLNELKGEEFEATVASWTDVQNVVVNDAAVDRYKVEKLNEGEYSAEDGGKHSISATIEYDYAKIDLSDSV